MARVSSREFVGTRVRLQRYRDAKLFHGWVDAFGEAILDVTTSTTTPVEIGDQFHVETFGHDVSGTFTAEIECVRPFDMLYGGHVRTIGDSAIRLIDAKRATVRLGVTSVIRYSAGTEAVRVRVEDLPATVSHDDEQFSARVIDIAPEGMGLAIPHVLEPGVEIDVTMSTPFGDIEGICVVRYCRRNLEHDDENRTGIKFARIDRINDQRWQRFLKEFV